MTKLGYLLTTGVGGGGGSPNGIAPVRVVYQPPPWVQMTTTPPPSQVEKGPEEWALPQQVTLGKTHTYILYNHENSVNRTQCVTSSVFLTQWITTLTSSSTCPEVTWTSASTSTPNPGTF